MKNDKSKNYIKHHFNNLASKRDVWLKKNKYFYSSDNSYIKFLIGDNKKVLELGCGNGQLLKKLKLKHGVGIDISDKFIEQAQMHEKEIKFLCCDFEDPNFFDKPELNIDFDYIILSDSIGYLDDCELFFKNLHKICSHKTKIILTYYSWKWQPVIKLAEKLKLKMPSFEMNNLSTDDTISILDLADFELVKREWRLLSPKSFLLIGHIINKLFAPLPLFRKFCIRNYIVAKPKIKDPFDPLSVSVVIPCKNERGNVESAIKRIPKFGKELEIIFVEGGSHDGTQEEINRVIKEYPSIKIKTISQDGKGKGDAVRKAFSQASGDILMILDADLTVPPEDLPKFYDAIINRKGEFINGTRLVYPMHDQAMRFLNLWANKTFSVIFSWLLNQRLTDTLCGTKVLLKKDYLEIVNNRSYFGDFDPFGDFDLIFGATKSNLKIIEIPIRYDERKYGSTQISRFRHGWLLLKMVVFAYKKLKLI